MRYGFVAGLIIALSSGLLAPPAGAQRESLHSGDLVGSWVLVSYTRDVGEGDTIYPFGEDGFGRLIYQSNGTMAMVLMRRDRSKLSGGWAARTQQESEAITREFFAYSGTYTVDAGIGTVTHHVEACSNPAWVGGDQVRDIKRLSPERMLQRPAEGPASEVIWQREP
jgi:hypothetical protein